MGYDNDLIRKGLADRSAMFQKLSLDRTFIRGVQELIATVLSSLQSGGTVLVCGNGGSASQAQHLAGEIVGRFKMERRGLPAIALTADSSILTAIGNDYGFENIFARQVEAYSAPNNMVLGITTSGNSGNVLRALESARRAGMHAACLTGRDGGSARSICPVMLVAPYFDTAMIQEVHEAVIHLVAGAIDENG